MRLLDKLSLAFVFLSALALLWTGYRMLMSPTGYTAKAGDVLDTGNEPVQNAVSGIPLPVMEYGQKRVFLDALAEYKVTGVLASKHAYRLGFMDRLSPWDYAIAWGEVPQIFPWLRFSQSGRFCYYKYKPGAPVDGAYLQRHMSNHHLIPATKNIRRALRLGKKGMKVELEGYLVNVRAIKKGKVIYSWNTSLSRDDTGYGACEIIYLRKLRLDDTIYE